VVVAIIVLNWNNAADTLVCLESIKSIAYSKTIIIVVDNGSTDDSVSVITAAYPDIVILQAGENLGYAGGNNLGIRFALSQDASFICLLNNDTIVPRDFLDSLVSAFLGRPDLGIATPLIVEMDNPDCVWSAGAILERHKGLVERLYSGTAVSTLRDAEPFQVDVASGSALLIKRDVLVKVGLMDKDFFLYYEEVDWCLRAQAHGYHTMVVPSSVVLHKVSASLGSNSPIIDYYMLRNQLRLITRHWFGLPRLCLLIRVILRNLVTIAAFTVKNHNGCRLPHRNARLLALRDAVLGRWGKMGPDVDLKIS
jgi:GT2 family glycosyltransferase